MFWLTLIQLDTLLSKSSLLARHSTHAQDLYTDYTTLHNYYKPQISTTYIHNIIQHIQYTMHTSTTFEHYISPFL